MVKKIGIIGLGNVGEATIRSLKNSASLLNHRASLRVEIKGLCDSRKQKQKLASRYSLPFTTDASKLINDPDIDIIVELIGGIEPAYTYIKESLRRGKNIVTANKALLALHGRDIFSLAKSKGKAIGFEASVCAAIPLIKSISEGLVGCEVKKIYGILNGTTNYILHRMSKEKMEFSYALREAQKKGLAEKNPYLDIEGIDTLNKLCILSYLCFGVWPSLKKAYAEGISKINTLDILYAQELNYRIKLLAIAKKQNNTLDLRVHPTLIPMGHPLSEVSAAYNAVYLDTQPAGDLLFYGQGAGGLPTSAAVISDIVSISSNQKCLLRKEENIKLKNIKDIQERYYIRFMAHDRPGVLAKVSKILASLNISIASVTQKERQRRKFVPIIMLTHEAKENNIRKALSRIDELPVIKSPSQIIRIEDL
ncbi:MAG: homoserine dehydrogenase [Candidatus Omnitrophota bacterium]|nr:homoserine dehydrogenase [Candidatus Omnitrophota bacterium]